MFQFKKENEADCRTNNNNPEDSEGLEIEINDAAAAVISDDGADGVNEVPSMNPSSKKKKKKHAGLTKTIIILASLAAAIIIGVEASKAAKRASIEFQLAMNQAQADTEAYSKSGKGCKEFQVCVIDPIKDIVGDFGLLKPDESGDYLDELPDANFFYKYIKTYTRNCNHFWARVIYIIQVVIATIVNSLSDPARRALNAGAAVFAPATRALNDMGAFMIYVIDQLKDLIPADCVGLVERLGALFKEGGCIDIGKEIVGLEAVVDTCVDADWTGYGSDLQDVLGEIERILSLLVTGLMGMLRQ